MHHSLIEVLSKLPAHTAVYCGHEYSVSSLRFAAHVLGAGSRQQAEEKLAWANERRRARLTCLPSTIAEEMAINPFMRVDTDRVLHERYDTEPGVDTMTCLRKEKDTFKG